MGEEWDGDFVRDIYEGIGPVSEHFLRMLSWVWLLESMWGDEERRELETMRMLFYLWLEQKY